MQRGVASTATRTGGVRDEPRADAGGVDRGAAAHARVGDSCTRGVVERSTPREQLTARADDVRARLEERDHVVDVELARHVQHAIRWQRVDRRSVGGSRHPDGTFAAQHTGVDAVLRRVVHEHADELELGVADHLAQRATPDVPGRPLDHAKARVVHEAVLTS
jgi:hypothetical protein